MFFLSISTLSIIEEFDTLIDSACAKLSSIEVHISRCSYSTHDLIVGQWMERMYLNPTKQLTVDIAIQVLDQVKIREVGIYLKKHQGDLFLGREITFATKGRCPQIH